MNRFAVYIHIPFCTVKCGYCDFNAYAGMDRLKIDYGQALIREIESWATQLGKGVVTSIAFGGGTPGEMPAAAIREVLEVVRGTWAVEDGAEVSLEANPGTSNGDYFRELRGAGVTRLSLGAQSFNARELAFLDRIHSVKAIEASARAARSSRFESVSLDLIYGVEGQDIRDWLWSLREAVALKPDHISCYALTVEEGTGLGARVARGEISLPNPDVLADMYEAASEELAHQGFEHYELSNWAQRGHRSRHNIVYWTGGQYLGIGAGAHGYLDGIRYENVAHPRRYVEVCREGPLKRKAFDSDWAGGCAIAQGTRPTRSEEIVDFISLGLRLVGGFAVSEFEQRLGVQMSNVVGPLISEVLDSGVLEIDGGMMRLTPRGRLLHSDVASRLIADLQVTPPEAQES